MATFNYNPLNPIAIAPLPPHQQHLYQQQQQHLASQNPQPPLHQPAHMPRKRPKYSRSKLGCLSCRVRKVKCDEARPICTRCAHSQRECTWPAEVPKSKKGGSQGAGAGTSDSAPTSRPSTSSGVPTQGATTDDSDWQSDSAPSAPAVPGPIRNLSSAHGRQPSHSRNSSVGSVRGRDLAMTSSASVSRNASANASRSRDLSPNPFAFNVPQLPSSGLAHHHHHQRSASASSNVSASSLPYPLIPQQHPPSAINTINVPALSTSQTSSPSSGAFVQSPTMVWPPQGPQSQDVYGSRPGTSGSLVMGLGNIDLNNLNSSAFGTGLDGNGFPGGGEFAFGGAFDGSSGFGGAQTFGALDYGAMDTTGLTAATTNGFDPSAFNPSDMDTSSFLAQLQQQQPSMGTDSANYTPSMTDASISGNSSSGSPEMDVENLVGSLDPATLSSLMRFNQPPDPGFGGGGGGGGNQAAAYGSAPASTTTSAMAGFREAQTPMAASGFGLPQSTPAPQQTQQYGTTPTQQGPTSGFGMNSSSSNPSNLLNSNNNSSPSSSTLSDFGSNQGQPAPLLPQPLGSSPLAGYGGMTSTSSPMSVPYPLQASTMTMSGADPSLSMLSEEDPSSSLMPGTRSSSTAYGSTSGAIPQPPRPSDSLRTGARLPTTQQLPQQDLFPSQAAADAVGAGPFTDGARAGAPEDISLMERTMRMLNASRPASDLFPPASSTGDSRLAEDERARLLSDTPRPNLHQQQMNQTRSPSSLKVEQPEPDTTLFGSPSQPSQAYPPYQLSRPAGGLTHTRSRSDTITPQNALSPVRSNTLDYVMPDMQQWITSDGNLHNVFKKEDASPGARQWGALSPKTRHMIGNPDPLEPFFKTVQERNLIRHYCQTSTRLMMALPSSLNPILSVHLPIILSLPATAPVTPPSSLVSPPTSPNVSSSSSGRYTGLGEEFGFGGMMMGQPSLFDQRRDAMLSPASAFALQASVEALRLSVLGVAAIHQAYLLSKSGPENRERAQEMWDLAGHLRVQATRSLGEAVVTIEGCRSDAALGACVSIALIDIFAGGYNYVQNIELAKTLVGLRGGPGAIVRNAAASVEGQAISPSFEGPLHFVDAGGNSPPGDHKTRRGVLISTARLLLEILTIYDVFSTLTSGEQPTLLRAGDSGWWFEGDKSNYHLFSVENKFGVSRSMIELFARVSGFLNRHRRPQNVNGNAAAHLTVQGHPTPDPSRPSTPMPSLSGLTEAAPAPGSPLAPLHAEACALLREVETWNDAALPATTTSMHPRVKYGNYAHKSALLILLLREAFNLPHSDPRVQKCAEMTLLAALKASADFVMSVDLTWPVVIAGCQCTSGLRILTMRALEGFRKQCCFEIDTSELLLNEVWRRMDNGEPGADFRSVVDDLNLRVLIL